MTRRAARPPKVEEGGSGSGFGPKRLAELATRRPGSVLAAWGVIVLVSMFLIGALLPTAVTSDSALTNNPESSRAKDLIDARLPGPSRNARSASDGRYLPGLVPSGADSRDRLFFERWVGG